MSQRTDDYDPAAAYHAWRGTNMAIPRWLDEPLHGRRYGLWCWMRGHGFFTVRKVR